LRKSRFYIEWALVFLVTLTAALLLAKSPAGDRIDNALLDQLSAFNRGEPDPQILLIAIDDAALEQVGPWPWDRAVHARLLDRLSAGGVKAIGLDILFAEPAPDPRSDTALAAALERAGNVVVPAYFRTPGSNGRRFDLVQPIAPIADAARGKGHVNVRFDDDAIVRRAHLRLRGQGETVDHFALAVARLAHPEVKHLTAAAMARALPDRTPHIIPYQAAGSYPAISASALLAGEVPDAVLKGKIALVGATAPGMGDSFAVPGTAGHVMPGIEIQANMVDALLRQAMRSDADSGLPIVVVAAFLALLLTAYWFLPPTASVATTALLLMGSLAAIVFALFRLGIWFPPSGLLLAALLAYPLWSWRRLSALNSYIESEAASLRSSFTTDTAPRAGFDLDRISSSIENLHALVGRVQDVRTFMEQVINKAPDAMTVVDSNGQIILANPGADRLFAGAATGGSLAALLPCAAADWTAIDDEMTLASGEHLLVRGAPLGMASAPGEPAAIVRLIDISAMRALEAERSEMLEFLSHDMRAPQAAILALVGTTATSEQDPVFARIRRQAETGLKLADDFVQLARLDGGSMKADVINMRDLLGEVVDRFHTAAAARGVDLERPADGEPALVLADPWMLDRAFGNLVDNAIKFSPPGGTVRCCVEQLADSDIISASVEDSGSGLSAERRADPFARFGSRENSSGTGLGLAYVKKAAEAHGAEIDVASSDRGTRFTLRFQAC
jgi:CHASE2 domain-containing sensor protein/signal transduction histidine kinase